MQAMVTQPPRQTRCQHDLLAVAEPNPGTLVNQGTKQLEFTRPIGTTELSIAGAGKIGSPLQ